jgi:hypothetical protein
MAVAGLNVSVYRVSDRQYAWVLTGYLIGLEVVCKQARKY